METSEKRMVVYMDFKEFFSCPFSDIETKANALPDSSTNFSIGIGCKLSEFILREARDRKLFVISIQLEDSPARCNLKGQICDTEQCKKTTPNICQSCADNVESKGKRI